MERQQVNVTQAAKLAGVSRNTIYRNISTGKLSRQSNGFIQVSELIRVFGELSQLNATSDKKEALQSSTVLQSQNDTVTALKAHIEQLEQQVKDLKEDKEQALEREKRLMALLEHQANIKADSGGLFGRLFSK